jgi:hypothetical protein
VRRGDAGEELYAARLRSVETALAAAGVEPGRVRVSDRQPGGVGLTSERMLEVLEKVSEPLQTQDANTRSSSGASSQSGMSAGSTR